MFFPEVSTFGRKILFRQRGHRIHPSVLIGSLTRFSIKVKPDTSNSYFRFLDNPRSCAQRNMALTCTPQVFAISE